MPTYIYDRKSRQEQTTNREIMEEYAIRHGLTVEEVFIDKCSGKTPHNERDEWRKMQNKLKDGDVIIMEKIDRYSRDVVEGINHMKYLDEEGISVVFVHESIDTSTAMGRFNFGLKLLLAQLEREQTAERTTTTLRLKRMRGEKDTYKRYGWDEEGQPIKSEQRVLQRIRHDLHNDWGLTAIAEGLNKSGNHKRNGKEWAASDIYKIKNGRHFEMMDYDYN
jgi:DNA invertase Pin-like site-specific DNA recombinase